MAQTFTRWPHDRFDLRDAYVPLADEVLEDLLADETPVTQTTRDWAAGLMDARVHGQNGFFVVDGSSYPDLDPETRIHMTKRLAPCLGTPIVHHSEHLKQDLVTNVKDVGVRFTSSKDQNFSSSN